MKKIDCFIPTQEKNKLKRQYKDYRLPVSLEISTW